ncbi:LPXTG-motif cell wall-anchored protein [Anaerotaenia torta]|uniref:GDSL-type esterase/lipase family protein n=1 Tax=Anaerotaenia torta TaxID=433293 RepID=UPI003D21386F
MRKRLARGIGIILLPAVCFTAGSSPAYADTDGQSAETGEVLLFAGAAEKSGKDQELAYFFTAHVGGKFDGAAINEGSYFCAEVEIEPAGGEASEEENFVYLAFSSASGGPQWVAVYPDEVIREEEADKAASHGRQKLIFRYENFARAFGTGFARLDIIRVYTGTSRTVKLKQLSYIPGTGEPTDTGDGAWDRPLTGIAFIGDSIVQNPLFQYGDWNAVLGREDCVNYGIGAQTTTEVAARWDDLLRGNYEKIVILCGINDLGWGRQLFSTIKNYREMFESTHEAYPETRIFVISVLPTTDAFFKDQQNGIVYMNAALKNMIKEYDYVSFVDCYSAFVGEDGYCNPDYVSDGLHPNKKGYEVIAGVLTPYLDGTLEDGNGKQNSNGDEDTAGIAAGGGGSDMDRASSAGKSGIDAKQDSDAESVVKETAAEGRNTGQETGMAVIIAAVLIILLIILGGYLLRRRSHHSSSR